MGNCTQNKFWGSLSISNLCFILQAQSLVLFPLTSPLPGPFFFPETTVLYQLNRLEWSRGKDSQSPALSPPATLITPAPSLGPEQLPFLISQFP